ncbi:ribonuclease Y [Candidatus Phytoplasma fraxini]|uniref:Ribonuclease Y n=1 Tax=Ash yellows phytoplasma TaxID=35780 RepID=A0ABZ2U7L8_ASHYP
MNTLVNIVTLLFVFMIFCFFYFFKKKINKTIQETDDKIKRKLLKSKLIAEKIILDAEYKISLLKKEVEDDLNQRRKIIINLEEKIIHKEEMLVSRFKYLNDKEESLYTKEKKIQINQKYLEELRNKIQQIIMQQQEKLEQISELTQKEAQEIIFKRVKENTYKEMLAYEHAQEREYKFKIKNKAKNLLVFAMQKLSREVVNEHNVSIVFLEQEEIKGRIIGKEGRNIKSFELVTGVDLIIDDNPNIVMLSCFDPIRREIAKRTLESLIVDGRITPASVEKIFSKISSEVDDFVQEIGEATVYEAKIGMIEEELVILLGKLHFRTSYGQNVLNHSLEVSFLAGILAAEIGENEIIARRAGLLHDIGKALDHHIEGSHVKIGVDLAIKYKEPIEVIDTIASHHEEQEPTTLIAVLVSIADTISSTRPGARRESINNYIQRVTELENIADSIEGVEKAYAIRSGRELRVIVNTEEVDDLNVFVIAKKIKKKIQNNINYNGSIKITVLRELRVIDVAEINSSNL